MLSWHPDQIRQAWRQEPLSSGPSHWPCFSTFKACCICSAQFLIRTDIFKCFYFPLGRLLLFPLLPLMTFWHSLFSNVNYDFSQHFWFLKIDPIWSLLPCCSIAFIFSTKLHVVSREKPQMFSSRAIPVFGDIISRSWGPLIRPFCLAWES